MKYRKRSIVVEAWQYRGRSITNDWPEWVRFEYGRSNIRENGPAWGDLAIVTLEGGILLKPGNWLVKGIKGEIYPVNDDVFRATYDPVTETETTPLPK